MKWLVKQAILWHRYLGIGFCLFFAVWFVSGIVMMYASMPELTEADRLAHLPKLDLSTAKLTPAASWAKVGLSGAPLRITVAMIDGRPVYRFLPESGRWVTVFADDGEILSKLDSTSAVQIASAYQESPRSAMHVVRELPDVDQWTVYPTSRAYLPFQLVAVEDGNGTEYYVSEATGSVYLRTTSRSRFLAWCGAIPHWWYIRSLRANTPLWRAVMITASGWGIIMSVAGILAGILRFSPSRRYRFAGRSNSYIPYVGWKRWHYYFAAGFGLVTFTWILSGFFTMNPGKWSPGPNPTEAETLAFAGADLDPNAFDVLPARAVGLLQRCIYPNELEMISFQRKPYYVARDQRSQARLLSGQRDSESCISEMPTQELLEAGGRVAGNAPAAESAMLNDYDAYYYDRTRQKPLPVLRLRFGDARQTWLYINPKTASIQARYTNRSRYERWLYQGLHDLDFPFLYWHRPAWDLTVIILSIGGMSLIVTSIVLAVKYLQRSAKRHIRTGVFDSAKHGANSHRP
jgi:PepSY-associated TM region